MSLLTMIQQAIGEVGDFESLATIVGNNNPTAVQMLAIAQKEGRELSRRHEWQVLINEKTQALTAFQNNYAFPSDFRYALNMVWFDRTERRAMTGPITPQQWQGLQAEDIGSATTKFWRIRGDEILIYPTPDATDTIAYEYVSTSFCKSSGGTLQAAWAADTDVGRLSEDTMTAGIVWRFLQSKGLPFQGAQAEYERTLKMDMGRDGASANLAFGGRTRTGRSYMATDVDVTWSGSATIWGQ
jgi:hypothetical protein